MVWLVLGAIALGSANEPLRDPRPVQGLNYFWGISGSPDTPAEHGVLPWTGERDVYLWLECAFFDGVTRAQIDLETSGMVLLSFTPANGFTQGGVLPHLDLSHTGCPTGPITAGVLRVEDATGAGGWICAGPTRALDDCQVVPGSHDLGFFGLTTKVVLPCSFEFCPVDFVIPYGWGKVKAQYR